METGKFTEMLDKLNTLKNEGLLDENEYERQVNKLKKQYLKENDNYYGRNLINNANVTRTSVNPNAIASLLLLVISVIVGIWFFSSDMFKELTTAGKELSNSFENHTTSKSNSNNSTSVTSTYSNNTNSKNSSTSNNANIKKPSSNNSSASNTQIQTENKKTYNINVRKVANLFRKGEIALTIMNYQTETYNSKVGGVKDGQEWVIVNMKFENKSNSTVIIDKNDFKIVDGAGRYGYRPWYKHLETELDMKEVRAGQTATFSIRFVYYQNNEIFLRYYNSDLETNSYDEYIDLKLR